MPLTPDVQLIASHIDQGFWVKSFDRLQLGTALSFRGFHDQWSQTVSLNRCLSKRLPALEVGISKIVLLPKGQCSEQEVAWLLRWDGKSLFLSLFCFW